MIRATYAWAKSRSNKFTEDFIYSLKVNYFAISCVKPIRNTNHVFIDLNGFFESV